MDKEEFIPLTEEELADFRRLVELSSMSEAEKANIILYEAYVNGDFGDFAED